MIITTSTTSKYSDSPWCEPNAPLFKDVFLVVFGDKKVSWISESHVGICGFWPVHALRCHVTTHVSYVTVYKKCTQTSKIISCQKLHLNSCWEHGPLSPEDEVWNISEVSVTNNVPVEEIPHQPICVKCSTVGILCRNIWEKKQNLTTTKAQKDSELCSSCFSPSLPQQMMITTNNFYNKEDNDP